MRKKHLVRNIILIASGFILLLIILAEIFKNDIVKMAIQKGAKTFDVPLSVGEVDFSLLYNFPNATIEFNDIVVLSDTIKSDSMTAVQDTIAKISKLYAAVDIVELIKGNILVKRVDIEQAKASYLVDSLGKSNWDFLLNAPSDSVTTQDTTVIQGVYSLDKFLLSDIDLNYIDDQMHFAGALQIPELEVSGEVKPQGYEAATKGEILVKSVHYADFHLEDLQHSRFTFDITALNDTLQVDELVLDAANAVFKAKGMIVNQDSMFVDLQISGEEIDLEKNFNFLSKKIKSDLKLNNMAGELNISGSTKGYVTSNNIPQFNFDVDLKEGLIQYDTYPRVKNMVLQTTLSNGYATGLQSAIVNVKQFSAETEKSTVEFSAMIKNLTKIEYDVVVKVSSDLSEIKPFVPDSSINKLTGILLAEISTSGVMPDSLSDDFVNYAINKTKISLSLNNVDVAIDSLPEIKSCSGTLKYEPGMIKMSDFKVQVPEYHVNVVNGYINSSYKGKLTNYKKLYLDFDSVYFALPQSSFSLKGKVSGFEKVKYDLQARVNLGLEEVKTMLPDSIVNYMIGQVGAGITSKGQFHIDSVADKAMALLFENSSFNLDFNGVNVNMPDSLMSVSLQTGKVSYTNDTLRMNGVTGNYLGLDFSADSTYIASVYSAAIQNKPKELRVYGNFGAGDLDYAWIDAFMTDTIPMTPEEEQAALAAEPYVQNYTIKANGKAKLKSFKYGDIFVENIDTKFLAKPDAGYFVADDMTCNVFGGEALSSVKYEINDNFRDVLYFKTKAKSMNMSTMLNQIEEFVDYEDFSSDKVKGTLSSEMDGRIVLQDYEVVFDSLMLSGSLKLENGALVKVKPIMDLEDIPMIGLSGLKNLRFSTLESSLFIYNNKVYIPQTQIQTTSFDASFLGMYGFDETYAYHVRMFLGEILAGKSKANIKKQTKDMGFVEDEKDAKKGRTPLYLISSFDGKKDRAWWDNQKDREKMQIQVKLQQRGLRILFKPSLVKYETEVK